MTEGRKPGDRIDYSAIVDRPPLPLPDGARMVVWPILALEVWDVTRPMPRTTLPPPQGTPLLPDVPNWSWHEYGMRVGFWRVKALLDRLGLRPTVTLNARVCLDYPVVARACVDAGWELNAHAYEQIPMHKLEDERASIRRAVEVISQFGGRKPRGWFGPGLTQTFQTLDHLAAEGIEYIGDWVLDDQPVDVRTDSGPIVALPYNYELHDIVQMAIQHHESRVYRDRAIDYFDTLYEESQDHTRVMSLAFHPYLIGSPHRIRYAREVLEYIVSKPDVVVWDGEQILDWYLAARPGGNAAG